MYMKWDAANEAVEHVRRDERLYLPPLTEREGFCSTRVEHLLRTLRLTCPVEEDYLEVGVLEGRTLTAVAGANFGHCIGVDPCEKYGICPSFKQSNITFLQKPWEELTRVDVPRPIGVLFYDGDHEYKSTYGALTRLEFLLADEAVVVVDDWDRNIVRDAVFAVLRNKPNWRMLRELPEYTGGPNNRPNYVGFYYGLAVLGVKRT